MGTGIDVASRRTASAAGQGELEELSALLANPLLANEVQPEAIPALLTRLALEQARLTAVQTALATRLLAERAATPGRELSGTAETLGLRDVARLLQKSTSWVRRAVRRGDLSFARRVGRSLIFPREQVNRYLDRALPCYDLPVTPVGSEKDARAHRGARRRRWLPSTSEKEGR